jgi:hypothetical protein
MLKKLIALITGNPSNDAPQPDTDGETGGSDLSKEDEERYIKLVQISKMRCQYAEGSLEGIDGSGSEDDLYETEHVEKLVSAALEHANEIEDEFYRSAALHPVAELLTKAGQFDRAAGIIDEITVESINEIATEFLEQQKGQAQ